MRKTVQLEDKEQKKRIDLYVKENVFRNLKFILSWKMMNNLTRKNSLCKLICTGLNIREEEQQTYWSRYSRCVEKSLNAARNDAVSAMKSSFLVSKCKLH